ncbi:hypothetical protein BST81_14610 [Leptolyngbya sp. 'hensonii']|uniref:hypothetical protein n=1 Tax=Leptolyngbya sp. 'hensonii' TaxID=1922337 RepID=UPI00094F7DA1|nr:hypothetical protein [Leptolyngbya sp. 'hensonii']OLP17557.1 hypothetical protein BST81_14610 [Leptolyngbya sp. 'hensonii']
MMSSSPSISNYSAEEELWDNLKKVITSSSGFQRWQLERSTDEQVQSTPSGLDYLVRLYLRETLETLAY